jgi:hypothetical protein
MRNTITNDRLLLEALPGRTVQEAVKESGFVHGDFSVRDKDGNVVDEEWIDDFEDTILNVGLPGRTVVGGY